MINKLVSIIVPVYNVEDYLNECLDSIVAQTYKNLEIIIIDDGSTDNSSNICDMYKSKDSRIKVIHTSNHGLSAARNIGIDASSGDYICFVDSDDFISVHYVEDMLNVAVSSDSDVVICKYHKYSKQDIISDEHKDNPIIKCDFLSEEKLYDDNFISNNNILLIYAWNKMIDRRILKDIRFPEGKMFEDAAVYYKILYNSKKTALIDRKLYYYRTDNSSITRSGYTVKKCIDSMDAIKSQLDFFIEKKKQRLIEISWDSYLYELWNNEKKLGEEGLGTNALEKYKEYLKKAFKSLRVTKSFSLKKYLRMMYISYVKY